MDFQALYMDNYGYYNPWLQNTLLQNLNNSAKTATFDAIKKALADYRNQAENLQEYTEFMQKWSNLFNRTISYYANMLSFDMYPVCTNAYIEDEYKSKSMKKTKKEYIIFLMLLITRLSLQKLREVLRHEVYYTWFRKNKMGQ